MLHLSPLFALPRLHLPVQYTSVTHPTITLTLSFFCLSADHSGFERQLRAGWSNHSSTQ